MGGRKELVAASDRYRPHTPMVSCAGGSAIVDEVVADRNDRVGESLLAAYPHTRIPAYRARGLCVRLAYRGGTMDA